MARYRRQQTPGDNLRELYGKQVQQISSGLGSSSIDWDDSGDDDESLDVTVSDVTVAKMGHDSAGHGFLVPNGSGWRTVQADAQARADTAEADAKGHADTLNTAMDGRMDTAEGEINTLQLEMNTAQDDIDSLQASRTAHAARLTLIEDYLQANPINGNYPSWA